MLVDSSHAVISMEPLPREIALFPSFTFHLARFVYLTNLLKLERACLGYQLGPPPGRSCRFHFVSCHREYLKPLLHPAPSTSTPHTLLSTSQPSANYQKFINSSSPIIRKVNMKLCTLFSAAFGAFSLAVAAPTPEDDSDQLFLRVYAPDQPWHNMVVVQHESGQLGLRNSTEHPEISPAFLESVDFEKDVAFAFQFVDTKDYLAIIQGKDAATVTDATIGAVTATGSTDNSTIPKVECPSGTVCGIEHFTVYDPEIDGDHDEDIIGRLGVASFKGLWQVKEDAPEKAGWLLHFVGEKQTGALTGNNVQVDILPRTMKVATGDINNQPKICQIYRFMCVCCK
ncbi:hypothetical protein K491DRAFT_227792 [Lophiostoma macrostomum CBS 122681]|uniref:Uncharacterized protein n=1 Tax=Lophiostoma macrostomum CBS 122681 TaxID=1314788 RepID=A0A6A6SPI5_9PLEO|nr:hypothetical protein K491DRAFT_227792 [Lophiostoma macrostomum CBS 122681]